jgi:hypothetical protein
MQYSCKCGATQLYVWSYVQVRHDIVLLLPRLRTASEKYVNIVLDKRKTLLLQRKDPSAAVSKLPEAPAIIIEGAAGALPF